MTGDLNFNWAREVVGALVRGGVIEVEIAPGSRSAPLVLAVRSFPDLRARVHLDERSAAFFALGYGRRAGRPAVVVTTSGTAVANLLPAVVEADISDVPLIVLSADRPPRLRGADANQTIDQVGIFGARLRYEADLPVPEPDALGCAGGIASEAMARTVGPPAGPVHLNVPFEKPLQPASPAAVEVGDRLTGTGDRLMETRDGLAEPPRQLSAPAEAVARGAALVAAKLAAAHRPILVAGPSTAPATEGPALADFAERLGVPLLADPLSGARFAAPASAPAPTGTDNQDDHDAESRPPPPHVPPPPVCGAYDHYLRDPTVVAKLAPDLILRTGRTPTSATLEAALERWHDAMQVVIDDGSRPKDHQRLANEYIRAPASSVLAHVATQPAATAQATVAAEATVAARTTVVAHTTIPAAHIAIPTAHKTIPATEPAPRPALAHWRALWSRAEAAAWSAVADALDDPANEGAHAAAVLRALPSNATLFVSSSMPVRDLDAYGRPALTGVHVLANRGANGIDGIVSSTLGCAAAADGPVVGLLGDLAFYHDMNGLLATRDPELNVVLVLVDNDGGGIFHMLPIRNFEPAFTPYFATPHGLDFRHAARLYGIPLHEAHTPAEAVQAVTAAVRRPGTEIVRVRTDRETNRRRHEEVRQEAARRAAVALGLADDHRA